MKFIHAADIHLDSAMRGLERYAGAPVDEIRGATRRAFDNLVGLAVDEGVELVLLAGDLYDGDWKDYNTGLYLAERMGRLRDAGIRVFVVAGNHDAASQITRHLRLPDNVFSLSTREPQRVVLDDLGVAINGQGFSSRAVTEDIAAAYPQGDPQLFDIGLLHTCLEGRPGHERYAPCTLGGLRSKGYQYWALGHIHRREIVSRDPWILFPGNTQGRHVRETGPKGCSLVTVEEGRVTAVEHRDLDVLRWSRCRISATRDDSVDDIYVRVREALIAELDAADGRPVAARLEIQGACRAHARMSGAVEHWTQEFRALASGLGGAGLWLEKVFFGTKAAIDPDELAARDDAFAGLLRAIRELELDQAAAAELAESVSALRHKLPPELLSGADRYDPTDPAENRTALEDVKELLLGRLLAAKTE